MSTEKLEERAQSHRSGGLDGWHYDIPFDEVSVRIDGVNQRLTLRFIEQANTTFEQVVSDISSRYCAVVDDEDDNTQSMSTLASTRTLSLNAC